MRITRKQLRRIIKEWRQNPAKIRLQRRQRDRDRMIDQMTFKQLKSKAFDSAGFINNRLRTGQYEYADIWEAEIPRLADYIDAAKVKAAEEGVTYDDIPEVIHNGGIVDLSKYSLGGLPDGIEESKIKITESQLRRIIREAIEPMTQSYVLNALEAPISFGPNRGMARTELVMQKVKALRFHEAASVVMDALQIDDPPMGADDELAKILSHQKTIDQIAIAAADWGTKHFRMR